MCVQDTSRHGSDLFEKEENKDGSSMCATFPFVYLLLYILFPSLVPRRLG